MKHSTNGLLFCLITTLSPICAENQEIPSQENNTTTTNTSTATVQKPHCSKQEIAQAVLTGVAHVAGNVGNIIKDPHNPHNVGGSVANMLSGLINIIAAAIKNRTLDLTDEETIKKDLLDMCQPMCDQITDAVVTRAYSL